MSILPRSPQEPERIPITAGTVRKHASMSYYAHSLVLQRGCVQSNRHSEARLHTEPVLQQCYAPLMRGDTLHDSLLTLVTVPMDGAAIHGKRISHCHLHALCVARLCHILWRGRKESTHSRAQPSHVPLPIRRTPLGCDKLAFETQPIAAHAFVAVLPWLALEF